MAYTSDIITRIGDQDAKTLKERLLIAERYTEKKFKCEWDRALELYKGEHFRGKKFRKRNNEKIVNYLLTFVESKVASIAFKYPEFTVMPLNTAATESVDIAHAAITYEWKISNVQRETRRALKDREIFGLGIVIDGWLFETEDGMRIEDGRHSIEGEEFDSTPNPLEDERPAVSAQSVREDRFYCKRINPRCFLVDPECGRVLDESEYCGYWELRPLVEVKKNIHFKNTRGLKGSTSNLQSYFSDNYLNLSELEVPYDVKRVKLYHYYERRRRLHVIFCDEHDKPLYVGKWHWETDIYPFRYLQGPGDEDTFFGMSPILQGEDPQLEIDEARSQLSQFRKTAVPHYYTRSGNMTRQAKEQIKSCVPGGIVETNGEPINPVPQLTIQPEVYQTETRAIQDMQTIFAVDQYQLGRPPTKRTTTTEVEAIQGIGGARAQADRQEYEDFCSQIALDCLNYLKMYSVKTRELPIYNQEGKIIEYWPDFTGNQIKGQYDIDVYVGSTEPPRDDAILESVAFFAQSLPAMIQSMVSAAQVGIDLSDALKGMLKKVPGVRDVDKMLANFDINKVAQAMQQPPPGEEQPPSEESGGGIPSEVLPEDGVPPEIPPELLMAPEGGEELPLQEGEELPPDLLQLLLQNP